MKNKSTCPALKEVRKKYPDMTKTRYRSYKRGWDMVTNRKAPT